MTDLTYICTNCGNQFVFSAGEQQFYTSKGIPFPTLCPICRALKKSASLHPPKPSR